MAENEVDRVASASLNLYSTLEAAFREFRTEVRGDLKSVQESTQAMSAMISEMRGANLQQAVRDGKDTMIGLETRVRTLEDFKNNITGRMLILAAIIVPATGLVSAVLSGFLIKVLTK